VQLLNESISAVRLLADCSSVMAAKDAHKGFCFQTLLFLTIAEVYSLQSKATSVVYLILKEAKRLIFSRILPLELLDIRILKA